MVIFLPEGLPKQAFSLLVKRKFGKILSLVVIHLEASNYQMSTAKYMSQKTGSPRGAAIYDTFSVKQEKLLYKI